jgi:hypothetical protein
MQKKMNNQTTTPLEDLRLEKQRLKNSCKQQEAKLSATLEYVEDNLIPISLGATAKAFTNPGKLVSSFKSSSYDEEASQASGLLGFIPKGIVGFALKAAFGFFIKKKFGKRSITGRILGTALPLVAPVAATALSFSQPFILQFVKSRVAAYFAWKSKRSRK